MREIDGKEPDREWFWFLHLSFDKIQTESGRADRQIVFSALYLEFVPQQYSWNDIFPAVGLRRLQPTLRAMQSPS